MEGKYVDEMRAFEGARYRPFCTDPNSGRYAVFDTRKGFDLSVPTLRFEEASEIATSFNYYGGYI